MSGPRIRVLYIFEAYPTLSETYERAEIEAVCPDYDVKIVRLKPASFPCKTYHPCETRTSAEIMQVVAEFRPHVLHTHYLHNAVPLGRAAAKAGLPFTVRAHSFDVLIDKGVQPAKRAEALKAVASPNCLGVLTFPFTRPALEQAGFPGAKLIDCWPVINHARFHDRSVNGDAILNVGACIPKKRMQDFVDLACLMPDRVFNLYAIGYQSDELSRYNEARGNPVRMPEVVEVEQMPAVYKRHGWLVYTACPKMKTVGWPMAVAEAQAAGLGICMPDIRPDIKEYVGPAGFLYQSIAEVPDILSRPYPAEMREAGFDHSRKSDIQAHKHLLTDLWDKASGALNQ